MNQRSNLVRLTGLVVLVATLASCGQQVAPTSSPFYAITRGEGGSTPVTSKLYYMDEFGAANLIGDTGAAFNSLAIGPDGTIYSVNRDSEAYYLYTLDADTGEAVQGSEITGDACEEGTVDGTGPWPALAFSSDGTLHAFNEGDNDLYTIDTSTGVATCVTTTGIGTYAYSMDFDANDTLWFVNGDGDVFVIGEAGEELVHDDAVWKPAEGVHDSTGDFQIRGGFAPSGAWWGVGPGYGYIPASAVVSITFDDESIAYDGVVDVESAPAIHMIAFP